MSKSEIKRKDIIGFGILLAIFVVRLFFCIGVYDEVFNIEMSYRIVRGQRYMVDNMNFFQMGDLFNLPFVLLFYKITGGVEGIVLFIRFSYLALNILLGFIFYRMLRKSLGDRTSFWFALILISVAPNSMYSIWYDSAALFFMLLGSILLAGVVIYRIEGKKRWIMGIAAGICHGCMTYAYPTMLLVILLTVISVSALLGINKARIKEIMSYWLPYITGGLILIGIFVGYLLYRGPENISFLEDGAISDALNGRIFGSLLESTDISAGANAITEEIIPISEEIEIHLINASTFQKIVMKAGTNIALMIFKNLNHQKNILVLLGLMLIQYWLSNKRYPKLKKWLPFEILIVGFMDGVNDGNYAHLTSYAFYFFWAPFIYRYLSDSKKRLGKILLAFMWIPSVAAWLAVGFTAYFPGKSCMGLYMGGIAGLIILLLYIEENVKIDIKSKPYVLNSRVVLAVLFVISNIIIYYCNVYGGGNVRDNNTLITSGVYKGIFTEEANLKYEIIEQIIPEKLGKKTLRTVNPINDYTWIYLWSDAQVGMSEMQTSEVINKTKESDFGNIVDYIPDLLFVENPEWHDMDKINVIYDLAYEDDSIKVYLKRDQFLPTE